MQRFLCIDGVEVSNPNRTIAYLKELGGEMLRGGPGQFSRGGDCGCWAFDPVECEAALVAGFKVTADDLCFGIFSLLIPDETVLLHTALFAYDVCPGTRPALPPLSDPGWVDGGEIEFPVVDLTNGGAGFCSAWDALIFTPDPGSEDPVSQCSFGKLTITSPSTGLSWTVIFYFDVDGIDPGAHTIGTSGVSLDGGITWSQALTSSTQSYPCQSTPGITMTAFNQMGATTFCSALLSVTGAPGAMLRIQFMDGTGFNPATTAVPPLSDPAWTAVGEFPLTGLPLGSCEAIPDFPATPTLSAVSIVLGSTLHTFYGFTDWPAMGPFDNADSAWSDSGVAGSWAPFPDGVLTLNFAADPNPLTYSTPAEDDAPWYDPLVPESADVLGVWLNTFDLSNPHKREKRDRTWGSSLGSTQLVGRELVISGVVFATNARATAYAKQWLYEALSGGCAGGPCGLPDGVVFTACPDPDGDGTDTVRTLKRIGLISYDPMEPDNDFPACWGFRFEATLGTETPFLYHDPVVAYSGPLVPEGQESVCNICNPCPALPGNDPLKCGCMNVPARVVQSPDADDCWCNPTTINRVAVMLAAPRLWADATAIIKITGGFAGDPTTPALRNLRIRAWPNPVGLPAPSLGGVDGFNCQEPCMEIDVACVPRGATLTIDGTVRRATLSNNGGSVSGYPYLSSNEGTTRFVWPEIACAGLMVAIDSDAWEGHTAADSSIEIELVGIDRG